MPTTTLIAELALDARAQLGEGPIWDARSSRLLFLDIDGHQVQFFDPRSGSSRAYDVGARPGAAAMRSRGGVVIAMEHGFDALDLETGRVEHLLDVEPGDAGNRMNDGKCDAAGRFWAGTMSLTQNQPSATFYRLGTDLGAAPMVPDVTISNGLAWTADNRTLYYIDTPTLGVDAFDFDLAGGTLANRRRFITIPSGAGAPDGMTIDADDCLWVALWGGYGLHRYTPDGRLDTIVRVPAQFTTSAAFGGSALDELYITCASSPVAADQRAEQPHAGGVFMCRPGVRGRPANEFAG